MIAQTGARVNPKLCFLVFRIDPLQLEPQVDYSKIIECLFYKNYWTTAVCAEGAAGFTSVW
jgi:hypothetical protein